MRVHHFLALLGLLIVLLLSTEANAQSPYRNRITSPDWVTRPTLSPWLELYRRDGIPDVPNYHQFVRPRQQMQRYLLERDRQMQRQQLKLQQLERQQTTMQRTQSEMLAPQPPQNFGSQTGIGASYMTHGGYFGGSHRGYFGAGR